MEMDARHFAVTARACARVGADMPSSTTADTTDRVATVAGAVLIGAGILFYMGTAVSFLLTVTMVSLGIYTIVAVKRAKESP